MESLQTGDLVYIPAELTLLKFDKEGWQPSGPHGHIYPSGWRKTTEPSCVLLVAKDENDTYHKIFYEGQCWSVPKHYVKSIRKENDNIAS